MTADEEGEAVSIEEEEQEELEVGLESLADRYGLDKLVDAVKAGVYAAGGTHLAPS